MLHLWDFGKALRAVCDIGKGDEQCGDRLPQSHRNQREIILAQADGGHGGQPGHQHAGADAAQARDPKGKPCFCRQNKGDVRADRHIGRLAEAEHTGQPGERENAGDGDDGDGRLNQQSDIVGIHSIAPYTLSWANLPEMPCGRRNKNTSMMPNRMAGVTLEPRK